MCIKNNNIVLIVCCITDEFKRCGQWQSTLIQLAKAETAKHGVTSLHHTKDIQTAHYSFDYAQNVHIPGDPMQCGRLYFLAPWKVGIFGVNCEGIPKQVRNYSGKQVNYLTNVTLMLHVIIALTNDYTNSILSFFNFIIITVSQVYDVVLLLLCN